ncbi:hypothetical protein HDU98_002909 [Podochytrium sp. JEL0797]|nr:hypothetical protein HDU98_002909 [Podochytrium sp. JEL0797]
MPKLLLGFALHQTRHKMLSHMDFHSFSLCLDLSAGHLSVEMEENGGTRRSVPLEPERGEMRSNATVGILALVCSNNETFVFGFDLDHNIRNCLEDYKEMMSALSEVCAVLSKPEFLRYISIFRTYQTTGMVTGAVAILSPDSPKQPVIPDNGSNEVVVILDSDSDSDNDSDANTNGASSSTREESILTYPPTGPNAVTLYKQDLARLEEGEYLNDSLIEFYIRFITHNVPSSQNSAFHIFNTFFYSQLNARDSSNRKLPIQKTYSTVSRWTLKIPLFSLRFFLIPIHDHDHWYLACVWNPGAILATKSTDEKCTIVIFDSLLKMHPNVGKCVKQYLGHEAREKLGRKEVDLWGVEVVYAKVQDQLNYCDCGLFLLHHMALMVTRGEEVVQAVRDQRPLNTSEFGTLEHIRGSRRQIREIIDELVEGNK